MPSRLAVRLNRLKGYSSDIAAGPVQALHPTEIDRVTADREDDRYRRGRALGGERGRRTGGRDDDRHAAAGQVGRQFRQAVILSGSPAEFDRHVLAVDKARFAQPFAESRYEIDVRLRRAGVQIADDRHRLLLPRSATPPPRRRAA
jgi:hypothetical protein